MNKLFIIFIIVLTPLSLACASSDCGQDPICDRDQKGEVKSAVWVRDWACVENSQILATLQAGWVVKITGYTDGWYRVITPDGIEGWSGEQFFTITDKALTSGSSSSSSSSSSNTSGASLTSRVKGYILLQVQQNGEAWYVYPQDSKRYYLGRPADAFEIMRKLGLGATHEFITSYTYYPDRVLGKILLDVELNGEAYYIYPKDKKAYYLGRPADAFAIMRELGLGITDADLAKISTGEIEGSEVISTITQPSESPTNYSNISVSSYQEGVIPAGVESVELNEYWTREINELRAAAGLRQLVLDQRFVDTATEWAVYMGKNDIMTHTRPDGKTMHQWIDTKGLDFTERYSDGGWTTNYFTENISWNIVSADTDDIKQSLDEVVSWMLAEGQTGAHYRTIYHVDWNTVGCGFYFLPVGSNQYKIYAAYHYGSLVIN